MPPTTVRSQLHSSLTETSTKSLSRHQEWQSETTASKSRKNRKQKIKSALGTKNTQWWNKGNEGNKIQKGHKNEKVTRASTWSGAVKGSEGRKVVRGSIEGCRCQAAGTGPSSTCICSETRWTRVVFCLLSLLLYFCMFVNFVTWKMVKMNMWNHVKWKLSSKGSVASWWAESIKIRQFTQSMASTKHQLRNLLDFTEEKVFSWEIKMKKRAVNHYNTLLRVSLLRFLLQLSLRYVPCAFCMATHHGDLRFGIWRTWKKTAFLWDLLLHPENANFTRHRYHKLYQIITIYQSVYPETSSDRASLAMYMATIRIHQISHVWGGAHQLTASLSPTTLLLVFLRPKSPNFPQRKLHSKQTVTEYNCHTKSQSKNPSKTKETTSLAETLVPTSKLCEVWASEIRVFGGHTNFQFELCVSNCVSVFHAFSCILMHFAMQNSWFSHAVLHSPWIAQILHKGSRFL